MSDRFGRTGLEPPKGWFRQYAKDTARDEIVKALVAAGLPAGQHHTGSGWSDEGNLEYRPPEPGWVTVGITDAFAAGGERHTNYYESYYWAIDHAGKGRKEALVDYAMALAAAGLPVVIGTRKHQRKLLVIVDRPVNRSDGRWSLWAGVTS